MNRIKNHPILEETQAAKVPFYWNDKKMFAKKGEMLASALIANGIKIFGHHAKDDSPQGIFCANGQCAQCTVIANGRPIKSCMTPVEKNMMVEPCEGLPELPNIDVKPEFKEISEIETEVLIIGAGPAGLSAGLELAKNDTSIIIADDKMDIGGKLVLQTHKFFGSTKDCYAGTRGINIAKKLVADIADFSSVKIWNNSVVLYIFSDKKVGILRDGEYCLVKPKIVLNAAGAREKMLPFPGNTLPGVYGAGAFQTLVNRDLVKSSEKVFIIGGGNVGLIAGYHALQANMKVVGLAEALEKCGGYKVHHDKLVRFGVPIYTSHTVISASGEEHLESVTIAEVNKDFQPIGGTEKTIKCDTLLIAVGLDPIKEFEQEAAKAGMAYFSTGDAKEIAEASSAMFDGKVTGIKVAKKLGKTEKEIPAEWSEKAEILKSPPGKTYSHYSEIQKEEGVFPVFHCLEEIPCNPCISVCPFNSIKINSDSILGLPSFEGKCIACGKCLTVCPGLAITLVDFRKGDEKPVVSIPFEFPKYKVEKGDKVTVVDIDGIQLKKVKVVKVQEREKQTKIIQVKATKDIAKKIAGIQIQDPKVCKPLAETLLPKISDDTIVCRCERVTAKEIRDWIKKGVTDMNQLKQLTRAGMGACGAKTCENIILRMYKEEGYDLDDITRNTRRPLFIEVPLGDFAEDKSKKE
ncbi:MAG: (2Fe-2S)-binding protein [Candidatus Cloacimonetes bacterium]|nr:(2Fe-2S)-binding protein [Candidatus Cloacimonadota bacterium]